MWNVDNKTVLTSVRDIFGADDLSSDELDVESPKTRNPWDYAGTRRLEIIDANNILSKLNTEVCADFNSPSGCSFGDSCHYAHGKHQLAPKLRAPQYHTKICLDATCQRRCGFWRNKGWNRCNFVHPGHAIRVPMFNDYEDEQYEEYVMLHYRTTTPLGVYV